MERRDGSKRNFLTGVIEGAIVEAAIDWGKPNLTLALSRRFGRSIKEQQHDWEEAHVVAGNRALERYDEDAYQEHVDAIFNPPASLTEPQA